MAQERTAPAEYFNDVDPEKMAKQLAEQLAAKKAAAHPRFCAGVAGENRHR